MGEQLLCFSTELYYVWSQIKGLDLKSPKNILLTISVYHRNEKKTLSIYRHKKLTPAGLLLFFSPKPCHVTYQMKGLGMKNTRNVLLGTYLLTITKKWKFFVGAVASTTRNQTIASLNPCPDQNLHCFYLGFSYYRLLQDSEWLMLKM